ncbi:hypothetical protein NSX24_24315, partial [Salmonella enterica]|nr:hypothetical protein [Salmonella enterica]
LHVVWPFFAGWLIEALDTWVLLRVVVVRLDARAVLVLEAGVGTLRALAFVGPAGLGVQELGYFGLLSALGVPDVPTLGAAFALLKR